MVISLILILIGNVLFLDIYIAACAMHQAIQYL